MKYQEFRSRSNLQRGSMRSLSLDWSEICSFRDNYDSSPRNLPCFKMAMSDCSSLQSLEINDIGYWSASIDLAKLGVRRGFISLSLHGWVNYETFSVNSSYLYALTSLSLTGTYLGRLSNWAHFIGVLECCGSLIELDLAQNQLYRRSVENWSDFGLALSRLTSLKTINLGDSDFYCLSDDKLLAIGRALALCQSLTSLKLDGSRLDWLSDLQWASMRVMLSQCSTLKSLHLGNGALLRPRKRVLWQSVGSALAQCLMLESLNLEGNGMDVLAEHHWVAVGDALAQCKTLSSLSLARNNLYNLSPLLWSSVGHALAQCLTLKSLDMRGNGLHKLSVDQWHAFCQTMAQCPSLQHIEHDELDNTRLREIQQILEQHTNPVSSFQRVIQSTTVASEMNPVGEYYPAAAVAMPVSPAPQSGLITNDTKARPYSVLSSFWLLGRGEESKTNDASLLPMPSAPPATVLDEIFLTSARK